jgi:biopolymer transport protein ExbD
MRRHRMPEIREGGVNVTPLIDIVMCLIIFFMLVAKIGVNTGDDPSIAIPATVLGKELADRGQALTLNVRPGVGDDPMVTALVEGGVEGSSQPQEIKLIDTVTNTRPLYEVLKKIKASNPDLKIIIRGDEEMAYKYLQPVLITCVEAKVKNVNFDTKIVRE